MSLSRFVLFAVFLTLGYHHNLSVNASAIPMWEFLSRDEKMNHLFRIFSQQVAQFCVDSSMPDCNKNLLVSGVRNLADMNDNVLDSLDPYQRGAKEIIWRALVKNGHSRIGYEPDETYFTDENDPLATGDSDTNGIGEETVATHDYIRPSSEHTGPYLLGPMVIRVYPDGRPVPEDSTKPIPRDEDIEEFRPPRRVPSIEDIKMERDIFYMKRSKGNSLLDEKDNRKSTKNESNPVRNSYPVFKLRQLQEVIGRHKIHYY